VRNSTGDKYLSVTAREMMISAAEVMVKYRKAAAIEGIVAL
jgi:adenylyl- and sulfurtransferase ThiI